MNAAADDSASKRPCPSCGMPVATGGRFCGVCGSAVAAGSSAGHSVGRVRKPPDSSRSRGSRTALRVGIGVLTAGAVLVVAVLVLQALNEQRVGLQSRSAQPSTPGKVERPVAVTFDSTGNLYVADLGSWFANEGGPRVHKLSPSGQPLAEWRFDGTGPIVAGEPAGIAVDRQGNVYVALHDDVQKLSSTGEPLAKWSMRVSSQPPGIALDGQGNLIVADCFDGLILKLSAVGQALGQWGKRKEATTAGTYGCNATLDKQGNLFVPDKGTHRILKYAPSGQLAAQWGTKGSGPGQFDFGIAGGAYLAIDAEGNILVADSGNSRLQKLSPTGQPLAQWGSKGSKPGEFDQPMGLAIDAQGNIFVADMANARVQKLSPAGQPLGSVGI